MAKPPPHPSSFTDEQLLEGAKHLAFEAWMMTAALSLYEETAHTARISFTDNVRENAAVESCLTHARALLEFLGVRDRPRHSTDMWPADFGAPEPEIAADRVSEYRARLSTIDQHLAHASWRRVPDVIELDDVPDDDSGPDDWPLPELVNAIVDDLTAVASSMNDSRAARHLRLSLEPRDPGPGLGRPAGGYNTNGPPVVHIVRGGG